MILTDKQQQIAVVSLEYRRSGRAAIWPRWCAGYFIDKHFHVVYSDSDGLRKVRQKAQKYANLNGFPVYLADTHAFRNPVTEMIAPVAIVVPVHRSRRVVRRREV